MNLDDLYRDLLYVALREGLRCLLRVASSLSVPNKARSESVSVLRERCRDARYIYIYRYIQLPGTSLSRNDITLNSMFCILLLLIVPATVGSPV